MKKRLALLLMFVILLQALVSCAPPTPRIEAVQSKATPVPSETTIPSSTPTKTVTPTPGKTKFIAPEMPTYRSQTPTATATLLPTVTPLPAKEFTKLNLTPLSESFQVYRRVELAVDTDGSAGNPFDPAQVDLWAVFTAPSGKKIQVPAFWYQEFNPATLNPVGDPGWRVRFTPTEAGNWTAQAQLSTPKTLQSAPLAFSVAADAQAHGFLRVSKDDPRYFAFDDDSFYFPVGLNVSWAGQDVLKDYTTWLDHLSANGGNYIRVWMAAWSFSLEWNDTGLGNYANRMRQAWLLDQVFRLAEERGITIMLCLINHGQFSETTNPEWNGNPYNAALGGPLEAPQDFVTNALAKDLYKRRVRYTAARWAYSTSLGVWEWWNEVNWTPISDETLRPWMAEMTAEIQKYDPYDHLVSTSYSNGTNNSTWGMPELDLAQQHAYTTEDPLVTLPDTFKGFASYAPNKPVLMGEYGSNSSGEDAAWNQGGLHLHNGLWAAPFAGYAGTAMYWWWDNYIEPLNLWYQYAGIANFMKGEDLRGMTSEQVNVQPAGATAMVLKDANRALVWIRADAYNYKDAQKAYEDALRKGKVPKDWKYTLPEQTGLSFSISGLKDGKYQLTWYSTIEGKPVGQASEGVVKAGTLQVDLPALQNDLALKIEADK